MARAVFEIYDEKGRLSVDLSKNLTRILGYYVVTNKSGSFAVNKQQNERLFAYVTHPQREINSAYAMQPIDFWFEGNIIKYNVLDSNANLNSGEYQLIYGVY